MSSPGRILVAGPPCGGKSTWAAATGRPVLDFDAIVERLSGDRYCSDRDIRLAAQREWWERVPDEVTIWTAPRRADRGRFREAHGAEVVVVMAPIEVCLRRAEDRPPSWTAAVHAWFAAFQPSRSGERVVMTG